MSEQTTSNAAVEVHVGRLTGFASLELLHEARNAAQGALHALSLTLALSHHPWIADQRATRIYADVERGACRLDDLSSEEKVMYIAAQSAENTFLRFFVDAAPALRTAGACARQSTAPVSWRYLHAVETIEVAWEGPRQFLSPDEPLYTCHEAIAHRIWTHLVGPYDWTSSPRKMYDDSQACLGCIDFRIRLGESLGKLVAGLSPEIIAEANAQIVREWSTTIRWIGQSQPTPSLNQLPAPTDLITDEGKSSAETSMPDVRRMILLAVARLEGAGQQKPTASEIAKAAGYSAGHVKRQLSSMRKDGLLGGEEKETGYPSTERGRVIVGEVVKAN